jgi:hypothetical protein
VRAVDGSLGARFGGHDRQALEPRDEAVAVQLLQRDWQLCSGWHRGRAAHADEERGYRGRGNPYSREAHRANIAPNRCTTRSSCESRLQRPFRTGSTRIARWQAVADIGDRGVLSSALACRLVRGWGAGSIPRPGRWSGPRSASPAKLPGSSDERADQRVQAVVTVGADNADLLIDLEPRRGAGDRVDDPTAPRRCRGRAALVGAGIRDATALADPPLHERCRRVDVLD